MPTHQTSTLQDLRLRFRARVAGNSLFYRQVDVDRAFNEGLAVACLETGIIQGSIDAIGITREGRSIYWVPEGITVVTAVQYEGRDLRPTNLKAISTEARRWMSSQSNQRLPVSTWGRIGLNKVFVWPAPARSGQTLTFQGIPSVTPLKVPEDRIRMPNEMGDLILDYAMQPILLREGGGTFVSSAKNYQGIMSQIKKMTKWTSYKNPRFWVQEKAVGPEIP